MSRLASLQPGGAAFRADNQQEMKAALPFKVVALGRVSELECSLQSCHQSAHGYDFEKRCVSTLKVFEDGDRVLKKPPDVLRHWPEGLFGLSSSHPI